MAEDGLDFELDFFFGFLWWWLWRIAAEVLGVLLSAMISDRLQLSAYTGTAFSLSGGFEVSLEELFLELFLNSWTSNCHRSTFSPVSLLVITTTSLEILPLIIHLLS